MYQYLKENHSKIATMKIEIIVDFIMDEYS